MPQFIRVDLVLFNDRKDFELSGQCGKSITNAAGV